MANYKILSDNFAGHQSGEVVSDKDLEGLNIEALIEGGHISKQTTKKAED